VNDTLTGLAVACAAPYVGRKSRRRLSILIYHRILAQPDPLRPGEPTAAQFDWQMRLLRKYFSPLPLAEAARRLRERSLPDRAVCVTFDDGYADNEQFALPILSKYRVPATVFVSTGFLNGGRMFNDTVIESIRYCKKPLLDLEDLGLGCFRLDSLGDRLNAISRILVTLKYRQTTERDALVAEIEQRSADLPADLMLSDQQVRKLASGGVDIGAHTVHPPILASLDDAIAREEILHSKSHLEKLLQREVVAFAYPNGRPGVDYTDTHRNMVTSLGFATAVATHWGVATTRSDPHQLPRFTPWDRQPTRFALRMLLNYRRADTLPDDSPSDGCPSDQEQ